MERLYTLDFSEISGYLKVAGYDVPLPKMPPVEEMVNYGLPVEEQKFRRTELPASILVRKLLNPEEEKIVLNEYHKFDNGIWILIKGTPQYFTGDYYHFLNYWTVEGGDKPYYYQPQQKLYSLYNMLDHDMSCLGTALLKARRMRATELTIHRGYFKTFRYRGVSMYMQSKNDDTAELNYNRILDANDNMIWFLKPINQGSSKNKDGLFFSYPATQVTQKQLREIAESGREKESIYEDDELGSKILFGPSVATHFDGYKCAYFILNEAFKLERMSLTKVISIARQCVTMNSLKTKIGMLHVESTVEELDAKQIKEVGKLIKESNPAIRNKNGRTTSGIFLIFMSAAESGEPDEFGMVDPVATAEYIKNTIDDLISTGQHKEAADERRKMPLSIEDAILPSGAESAFNKAKLQETLEIINNAEIPMTVRGNFQWENGIRDTRAEFIENPDGRWEVTKLLGFQDNHVILVDGDRYPGNISRFRCGIDPFSHKKTQDDRKSLGASVGFELFDENKDGNKFLVEAGSKTAERGGLYFETNQPVSFYLARPDDPHDFFEDMILQCVFFGMPANPENNKNDIINYFDKRGYGRFIINRPKETMGTQKQVVVPGTPASELTIEQYFNRITSYVHNYHNAIKSKELVIQLLAMNRSNIGSYDLGVAFGWCLIAVFAELADFADLYSNRSETEKNEWFEYAEEEY